jgi:hypothetical protein
VVTQGSQLQARATVRLAKAGAPAIVIRLRSTRPHCSVVR